METAREVREEEYAGYKAASARPPLLQVEGKSVLVKRFVEVDISHIEIDSHDPNDVIKCCQLLKPTFGGINLEDIEAPEFSTSKKR